GVVAVAGICRCAKISRTLPAIDGSKRRRRSRAKGRSVREIFPHRQMWVGCAIASPPAGEQE
ncbi:MAG TPA: hypothetical protein VLA52_01865, partial [Thermohalobaculum sp.]|nr:hypothetical protein [Thermohalobaculum sp.]